MSWSDYKTTNSISTSTSCICKRCGKIGIGSNGLCVRCDEALYGKEVEQK